MKVSQRAHELKGWLREDPERASMEERVAILQYGQALKVPDAYLELMKDDLLALPLMGVVLKWSNGVLHDADSMEAMLKFILADVRGGCTFCGKYKRNIREGRCADCAGGGFHSGFSAGGFDELGKAMKAADARVKPDAPEYKPGDYYKMLVDDDFVIYGQIQPPPDAVFDEPHMKHYRFVRAYSVMEEDGELGDAHVSTMKPITKAEFEAARARGWGTRDA